MRHSYNLLKTAEDLLPTGKGKPRESNIRRAASTVYYALFDCLARTCADLLIGTTNDVRKGEAWVRTYRALEHGVAKNNCAHQAVMSRFPSDVYDFAELFIKMQEMRHRADYDPAARFFKSEVRRDIERATTAIDQLSRVPATDRRAFAAHVLLKTRNK